MTIQDLQALVQGRRSIRGYDEKREVSDEAIRALLDCAGSAPSGGNANRGNSSLLGLRKKGNRRRAETLELVVLNGDRDSS
jgi:nitroreductase